jgi:hypothetical protein
MPKIKSQFLLLDPSFEFNIDFAGLPYEMTLDIPEGTLRIAVDVPSSEDFEDDGSMGFLFKHVLREAGKGIVPYLGITCSILLVLELKASQKVVNSFKKYQSFLENLSGPSNKSLNQAEIDLQKASQAEDKSLDLNYADKIFVTSRRYLKKLLLSLRQRGNFCRLKFSDYGSVHMDRDYGFFNKYYYMWAIRDQNNVELYSSEPFLLRLEKGVKELSRISIRSPVDAEVSRHKRDGIINETVWELILSDMKGLNYEPDIARTFLLDAQEQALSMNNNLAIISAAVACEVFTKRFISKHAKKIGNDFYDYVIEEVREVFVLELLDKALESLMGHSIKEDNRPLWNDLVRLFQARNKVAHTGECYYMSQSGKTKHAVDSTKIMDLIERVYELFETLESYQDRVAAERAH